MFVSDDIIEIKKELGHSDFGWEIMYPRSKFIYIHLLYT